jgi:hypothetical protein
MCAVPEPTLGPDSAHAGIQIAEARLPHESSRLHEACTDLYSVNAFTSNSSLARQLML